MASIHFVKNGKKANGERITNSIDISMATAARVLSSFEVSYSSQPPTINPEVIASDFAPYKHVVLEVGVSDTNPSFPQQGYYFVIGLDASVCQRGLGLSVSAV